MWKAQWSGSAFKQHLLYSLTLKSRHSWRPHITLGARDPWRATNPLDTQGECHLGNAQEMVSLSSNLLVRRLGQTLSVPQRSSVNQRCLCFLERCKTNEKSLCMSTLGSWKLEQLASFPAPPPLVHLHSRLPEQVHAYQSFSAKLPSGNSPPNTQA